MGNGDLMSDKSERITFHTISLSSLVGVVFVTLKLCGVIDWSWWLVLLPFYYWMAILVVLAIAVAVMLPSLVMLVWPAFLFFHLLFRDADMSIGGECKEDRK